VVTQLFYEVERYIQVWVCAYVRMCVLGVWVWVGVCQSVLRGKRICRGHVDIDNTWLSCFP
jgi:hypothetical protein